MENAKVSKNVSPSKFTDAGLTAKAGYVVESMTNNSHFDAPEPPLEEITTATNALITAIARTQNGSKTDTTIKQNCRTALELLLKREAEYVQSISGGSLAVILSSGFTPTKKRGKIGELTQATNLTIKPGGNRGSLLLSCDVVPHALYYVFSYTQAPVTPNSVWIQKTTTKHKLLIEGLISGTQYTFRVAGCGTHPSRVWSDDLSSYVL